MSLFIRVQSVEPRDPFVVHVRFTNGVAQQALSGLGGLFDKQG